jgi:thiol-disulfide isomerase/thioredoxin
MAALDAYRGNVVVLDFWASYCTTCLEVTPALEQLRRDYADSGLVVLGVSLDYVQDTSRARALHNEIGAKYEIRFDVDSSLRRAFNVRLIPLTVLVDRGGRVRWQQEGFVNNGGPVLRLASGRGKKALSAALAGGR